MERLKVTTAVCVEIARERIARALVRVANWVGGPLEKWEVYVAEQSTPPAKEGLPPSDGESQPLPPGAVR